MTPKATLAARLAAGLILAALLAPTGASATHRVAVPLSTGESTSTFLAGSSDGKKVLLATADALLPDQDQDAETDIYMREGGQLTLISSLDSEPFKAEFRAATPTLSHVVWETEQNVQSGLDFDNAADLYMWAGGQVKRVTANPSFSASGVTPYLNTRISADGARVIFTATENLGGEADATEDVYEYVNNGVRLLSKPSLSAPVALHAISSDGTHVFMSTTAAMNPADDDLLRDVYVSVDGAPPVLLTPGTAQEVTFAGASANGGRAYFHTSERLNVVLDTDDSRDVYESVVGGDANRLVSISATAGNGAHAASFQRVSDDGSRVFFTTREQLDPADADGEGEDGYDDVYMRADDTTTLITGGATSDNAIILSDISPDGTSVFWYSQQTFAGDTDGGEHDAWRWSEGVVSRITVGEINDQGPYASTYAGRSADSSAFVFQTNGPFTTGDTDTRDDLYLRAGGTTTLLTGAAGPCLLAPSFRCVPTYNGISADGSRVWFTSEESLHPSDTDGPFDPSIRDIYESRAVGVPTIDTTDSVNEHLEGEPLPIDEGLEITEATDDIFGAGVQITAGFEPTDVLSFPDRPGFSATLNDAGDTLTLIGRGTVADFEAALRSVAYSTASEAASATPRTIEFRVDNGGHTGAATRTLTVTPTDDPPVLSLLGGAVDYTNGAGPVPIVDVGVQDADTTQLTAATVKVVGGFVSGEDELAFTPAGGIAGALSDGGATLTLSGAASLADYEAVLKSVTYANDAEVPTEGVRTFEFTVLGGAVQSLPLYYDLNVARRHIDVANATLVYTENAPAVVVDPAVAITNFPSETITGATVQIVQGFAAGQDALGFSDQNGIAGTLTSAGDQLTLSGEATVEQYLTALRSVTYRNTSDAPSGADRVIRFSVTGGLGSDSRRIDVVPVEDAPVVSGFGGALEFTEGGAFLPIAPDVTVTDVDSAQITGAVLRIEGMQPGADHLSPELPDGISQQFDESTGTLTLTGAAPPADYQAALRSIVFFNDSDAPTSTTRSLTLTASSGVATSAVAARTLKVVPVNDPPAVGIAAPPLAYTTGDEPVAVDASMTVSDPDSLLQGATVKLTGEPVEGEDVLDTEDRDDGIAVHVDAMQQTVTLVGPASVAAYRTALRDVRYANRSAAATGQRTVQVQVTDGPAVSAAVTRTIVLGTAAPVLHAAPVIEGIARVGATLTASDGDWSGSAPMTFTRAWQRCAENGTGCTDIEGATGSAYAPVAADAGAKLRLRVVADNVADGTAEAVSALTPTVRPALAAPQITAAPQPLTNRDSAILRFSGEDAATFACAFDGAAFVPCQSPLALADLTDGEHVLRVRQQREGLTSPVAERRWTVDTRAPGAPVLLAGPDATTTARTASIGFAGAGEAGERFECSLDGADFAACSSPVGYEGLELGAHTVLVRGIDAAGNAGGALRVRWTVASVAPPTVALPARKLTLRAPARIALRARSFRAGCALDRGVLERCELIARVRRKGHLVRIGRGVVRPAAGQAEATVRIVLSARGRRVLRRTGRGARIRVTGFARAAGVAPPLVAVASLRAR